MAKSCVAELDQKLNGQAAKAVQQVVAARPHLQGRRDILLRAMSDLHPELVGETDALFKTVNAYLLGR